jgi:hypothetical protein
MVTCPWCGTSYAVFQPACSRCGGPIHPPEAIEAAGESPLAPPAAPRTISDSYAFKIMSSDGWSIAGLVFALLGGIFAVVGFGLTLGIITAIVGLPFFFLGLMFLAVSVGILIWRYQLSQKQVQVLKSGEPTLGCVTSLQENYAVQVAGRFPWAIGYQYKVNGKAYTGQVSTLSQPGSQLQAGRPVYVLYLRDNPAISSLYPHP